MRKPATSVTLSENPTIRLDFGDAADSYGTWPRPTVIVVDGPYGVSGFPGDPPTPEGLPDWYAPHVAAWAEHALPSTTLWFWGTEVGWASVHPVLVLHGWQYETAHVWDKGSGHIAGNVNSRTLRRFPVVTEMCVRYTRRVQLLGSCGESLNLKQWLRAEWNRSGMPLYLTNEACCVRNAATRKYFTQDHLWYFPPPEMMVRLARYAKAHGRLTDRPYFSLDGTSELTADAWAGLRAKWNYEHGVMNVWREPALRGEERLKSSGGWKCLHTNQKPLKLIERIVTASSDPGDTVWEPFGGLCSAAVASYRLGRNCYAAEISRDFYDLAVERIQYETDRDRPRLAI